MDFLEPVLGGVLIGFSAAMLLWGIGRIAGISGIVWQAFFNAELSREDRLWRWFFVVGLVLGPLLLTRLGLHEAPSDSESSWAALLIAGLLVGFGTRLGSGCTSGHGVCGIARFSVRSMLATALFMATGFVTVGLVRHLLP